MKKILSFLAIALIISCDQQKPAPESTHDRFRIYDDLFLNKESLSFDKAVIGMGLVDDWNTETLEKICTHSEFDDGEAALDFRIGKINDEMTCSISIEITNSLSWNDIKSNKVFMVSILDGDLSTTYILDNGIYKIHPRSKRAIMPEERASIRRNAQ